MKILYSNLNILHIRREDKNNTKEQCGCISTVAPSKEQKKNKKNGWVKRRENDVKDILGIYNFY